MEAREIVKAIRMKHRKTAAFVPEITLTDDYYHQTVLRQNPSYKEYAKRKGLLNDDYVVDDTYDMAKGKYARRIDLLMLDKQSGQPLKSKCPELTSSAIQPRKGEYGKNTPTDSSTLLPKGL